MVLQVLKAIQNVTAFCGAFIWSFYLSIDPNPHSHPPELTIQTIYITQPKRQLGSAEKYRKYKP